MYKHRFKTPLIFEAAVHERIRLDARVDMKTHPTQFLAVLKSYNCKNFVEYLEVYKLTELKYTELTTV